MGAAQWDPGLCRDYALPQWRGDGLLNSSLARAHALAAVRMALLRELAVVSFFDEPAHLDSERRESLAERLMALRGFSQLFVISHDDTFEQAAQSYVRIWRDADGSHALS